MTSDREPELHLIVLWEFARPEEQRILADIQSQLRLVHTEILHWPSDPQACYRRFYGANLQAARAKGTYCGGGPVRLIVVQDPAPRYGLRETSRGMEDVNLTLFDLKIRYREWTGGGHKVHTTNSTAEFRRDIYLLTGRPAAEWETGSPSGDRSVLPGQTGWNSLREVFAFLNELMPYAVLRNAESLPDRFDPSVHGDIDLMVQDADACASLLGAEKVFPERNRVHYQIPVGGRHVRFDFRFVGDEYYDRAWERKMLERRTCRDGVQLLHPEDAFFALVYHALFQKFEIADDYVGKAAALAKAAGIAWTGYDGALILLEEFLSRNGYGKNRPIDGSVRWNERIVQWKLLAEEIERLSGATDVHPIRLQSIRELAPLKILALTGIFNGRPCFIKYSPCAISLTEAEWRYPHKLAESGDAEPFSRPLFWHKTSDGGAFVILEWLDGTALADLIAANSPLLTTSAATIVSDLERIAKQLLHARIVHRDIHPGNLIIANDGHVKLIDFQFAESLDNLQEDQLIKENPRILANLGADFAVAPGKWNDIHSIRQCLSILPATAERDAALKRLPEPDPSKWLVARLGRRCRKKLRKRALKLRFRKLRKLLLGRTFSQDHAAELAFADYALREWR